MRLNALVGDDAGLIFKVETDRTAISALCLLLFSWMFLLLAENSTRSIKISYRVVLIWNFSLIHIFFILSNNNFVIINCNIRHLFLIILFSDEIIILYINVMYNIQYIQHLIDLTIKVMELFCNFSYNCQRFVSLICYCLNSITYKKCHSCNDFAVKKKKRIKCSLKHRRNRSQADEQAEHHPMF